MRRRARAAAAAVGLAGPALIAFHAGGYFDQARLTAALVALGLVVVAAVAAPAPLPAGRAGRLALAGLAAFAALAALSISWAPSRGTALDEVGRSSLYLAALVAAAALLRGRAARAAEPALLAGIVVVIAYGLSERLLPGLVELERSRTAFGRLDQPLSYWNAMGALAAIGLVLAARLAGDGSRRIGLRAAAAAAAAPVGAGLLLSFSRGGILTGIGGLLLLALLAPTPGQLRALTRCVAVAGAAGLAAALLGSVREAGDDALQGAVMLGVLASLALAGAGAALRAVAHEPAATAEGEAGRAGRRGVAAVVVSLLLLLGLSAAINGTGTGTPADGADPTRLASTETNRFAYWGVALDAFAEHPVRGLGAGGFALEWRLERPIRESARDAHSLWIETAAELGLLGLLALLALVGGVAVSARRALRADRAAYAGPAAALAVWGLHSAVDWDWEMPGLTLVAAILAGLLIAGADPPRAAGEPRTGAPARIALAAAAVALAAALAPLLQAAVLSDRAAALSVERGIATDDARFAEVRSLLRRAARVTPDPDPEFDLAFIHALRRERRPCAALAERVVRIEPRNGSAWRLLATCADGARAEEARRRAAALAPAPATGGGGG